MPNRISLFATLLALAATSCVSDSDSANVPVAVETFAWMKRMHETCGGPWGCSTMPDGVTSAKSKDWDVAVISDFGPGFVEVLAKGEGRTKIVVEREFHLGSGSKPRVERFEVREPDEHEFSFPEVQPGQPVISGTLLRPDWSYAAEGKYLDGGFGRVELDPPDAGELIISGVLSEQGLRVERDVEVISTVDWSQRVFIDVATESELDLETSLQTLEGTDVVDMVAGPRYRPSWKLTVDGTEPVGIPRAAIISGGPAAVCTAAPALWGGGHVVTAVGVGVCEISWSFEELELTHTESYVVKPAMGGSGTNSDTTNRPALDAQLVESESCPAGTRHVTYDEANNHRTELCGLLDTWYIVRLADGGSFSGPGYDCQSRASDERHFGHSLCVRSGND